MSVTCSPICRPLAGVSSSITCPACVCTFTRFVSVSTATTVASTVPVTCPEVPLAPGRSSLLVWMSTIDCEGTSTSTILPSMSVTCQVCFAPSTCTTVARSGCPKALGETSVVTANTTPSKRIVPGQDWRCISILLSGPNVLQPGVGKALSSGDTTSHGHGDPRGGNVQSSLANQSTQ